MSQDWRSYSLATYGDKVADIYDEFIAEVSPTDFDLEVQVLHSLAGEGGILELGVGTGRVALPLAALGHRVVGVDASPAMLDQLHAKAHTTDVETVLGDLTDVPVEGDFSLIFIVASTFLMLADQEKQIRCLANAAEHLSAGGHLVICSWVANPDRFFRNQVVAAWALGAESVSLEVSRYDPMTQIVRTQQVMLSAVSPK